MSLITLKRFREFFKCLELFCKVLRGFEKVGLKDWKGFIMVCRVGEI